MQLGNQERLSKCLKVVPEIIGAQAVLDAICGGQQAQGTGVKRDFMRVGDRLLPNRKRPAGEFNQVTAVRMEKMSPCLLESQNTQHLSQALACHQGDRDEIDIL